MYKRQSIGNPDHEDSIRVIHKALDAGINLIDTSDSYGDSEEVVGKALKGRRDSVVLATKFSRPMGDDPNQQGTSRRWIVTAVENSLRRLQTCLLYTSASLSAAGGTDYTGPTTVPAAEKGWVVCQYLSLIHI